MSEPRTGSGVAGSEPETPVLPPVDRTGPLAWMAQNAVAANLLMVFLVVGGILLAGNVKQEVFPEVDLDRIAISVEYRGATPTDVELGVVMAIEEAVRGLDGVKEVRSVAREGLGSVTIEMLRTANEMVMLNDVQAAVDRVTSLPADAERPVVRLVNNRAQVLTLVLYGEAEEASLRELAEQVRDGLLTHRGITQAELAGARAPEVHIEIDAATLRRYGLTHEQVAGIIRQSAVDLPAGAVRTASGEVLVRIDERRERGLEFAEIVLLSTPDGTSLRLGDIATIRDDFRETDDATTFNGLPAARVTVYRVGTETPISVSDAVYEWLETSADTLPRGVEVAVWQDASEVYADRIRLLLKNAYLGLILVLLVLGLFLEVKLAFWVTMGIPIAIIGSLTLMPTMDVSFNMISLFAFILTLGIVVDDAIVVGEAVYKQRERGYGLVDAAIMGVREVGIPVVFSVLTTIMVFLPMLFLPGISGKFFGVIPRIVIVVLIMSIVEALFILPAHLAHSRPASRSGLLGGVARLQAAFSRLFDLFVQRVYAPALFHAVQVRYLVIGLGLALLLVSFAFVGSGRVPFTFFPRVESDVVSAQLRMPFGTPAAETREVKERLVREAQALLEEMGGEPQISRGLLSVLGSASLGGIGAVQMPGAGGSHLSATSVFLVPLGDRDFTAAEFARRWRQRVGEVPGVEALTFGFATGPSAGAPVDIELSHPDAQVLEEAAARLADRLRGIAGVIDIDDGVSRGKEQLELSLRPAGRAMGLTEQELGRQVRAAFFGSEAVRLQRGRDELRVFVRRPLAEREREYSLETMMVRLPNGGEMPFPEVAEVRRSRSYVEINRKDGRRLLSVTADVDETVTTGNEVIRALREGAEDREPALDALVSAFPGLTWEFGGEQAEQAETMGGLARGFGMALLAMFGLLAIAFRSYVQPVIVLLAIPFGFIGAIGGHLLMGYSLSFMSMMGIVALSGVVVNSSLLLVVSANTYREEGHPPDDAVLMAAARRFRPVVLTALTTFFGLMPMILETSVQARFLIPMAISLGFGILFATFVTLFIVPAAYMAVEDFRGLGGRRPPEHTGHGRAG